MADLLASLASVLLRKEQMDNSSLRPGQQRDAKALASALARGREIVLGPNPIGIGKTATLLGAMILSVPPVSTTLISCHGAMVDQWRNTIQRFAPAARVFVLDGCPVSRGSFAERNGQQWRLITPDDMKSAGSALWVKSTNAAQSFFIAPQRRIPFLAGHLSQWFDVAIEDESYLTDTAMAKMHEHLRSLSRKFVWISRFRAGAGTTCTQWLSPGQITVL